MKTKEEIEKMAEFQFPSAITKEGCRFGFVKGYEKCQEDLSNSWTKSCECKDSIGQTWCCNQCGLPYDTRKEQDWTNFESEMMDWAHELGKEQKYIPFPAQVLQWIKNNYKLPQKK